MTTQYARIARIFVTTLCQENSINTLQYNARGAKIFLHRASLARSSEVDRTLQHNTRGARENFPRPPLIETREFYRPNARLHLPKQENPAGFTMRVNRKKCCPSNGSIGRNEERAIYLKFHPPQDSIYRSKVYKSQEYNARKISSFLFFCF